MGQPGRDASRGARGRGDKRTPTRPVERFRPPAGEADPRIIEEGCLRH
jgi:hypothetical protein